MSLFDALDSAIQETEEYKRNTDASEIFNAPGTGSKTTTNPNSKTTNPTSSTHKPVHGPDKILGGLKGQNEQNDSADSNAIKIGVSNNVQPSILEKLPPLPAKSTDPVVSTAMLKLTSMLAAPDEKVYSPRWID
jgi:hypothetical protein